MPKLEQVCYSGRYAPERGQRVLFVTERAVFRLGERGVELVEVAPGIDVERDVIATWASGRRSRADLKTMDARIFRPEPINSFPRSRGAAGAGGLAAARAPRSLLGRGRITGSRRTVMDIPENRFKRALKAGKRQIGLWSTLSSSYTVEVIAGAGFDWIMIDTEHSPTDLELVLGQLQAAAPYDTAAVVRIPWNDMVTVKRYLDIGVQTLLIPQVASAEEARNAVAYTRYPPAGLRGASAGATGATRLGRVKDYFKKAADEICVVVHRIRRGPAQPRGDRRGRGPRRRLRRAGRPPRLARLSGERAHAEVMPRIDDAISRIVKTGKAAGILADGEETARRWLALGALFVAVGALDVGLLARGAEALAAKFKDRG